MDLTTREKEVLRCLLEGRLNKQIAFNLDLSVAMVKTYLRRIYQKIGARHGREAMSYIANDVARASMAVGAPAGHTVCTDVDTVSWIVNQVCAEQDNRPDFYSYEMLDVETLRATKNPDPLTGVLRYYDECGITPMLEDFTPEKLRKFGRNIEPYHFIMDVDLRSKDNDFSKFCFVRGGRNQPTIRGQGVSPEQTLIANHPFKPLADELATRFGLIALANKKCYQRSRLLRGGTSWLYRSLSLPLFDRFGVCTHAIAVFDPEECPS